MVDTFAAAMSEQSKPNMTVVFAVIADLAQGFVNVKIAPECLRPIVAAIVI
jgi:hypothetical protein